MATLRPGLQQPDFETLYSDSDDPWDYRTRWYEQRKRDILLACLPYSHFDQVFEPGCGNGELTARLAPRCNHLLAADANTRAVSLARARVAGLPQVVVEQRRFPDEWPATYFDLVVVSELGYYLDKTELAAVGFGIAERLRRGGMLLACHWRKPLADGTFTGDEVHLRLAEASGLAEIARYTDEDFLLTVWCNNPESVATREVRL